MTLAVALVGTFLGPLTWNSILPPHRRRELLRRYPFKPFPVSWQDTGSGVFTLATASVLLGITHRREPAGRILGLAATVAAVAFLVDIYLY